MSRYRTLARKVLANSGEYPLLLVSTAAELLDKCNKKTKSAQLIRSTPIMRTLWGVHIKTPKREVNRFPSKVYKKAGFDSVSISEFIRAQQAFSGRTKHDVIYLYSLMKQLIKAMELPASEMLALLANPNDLSRKFSLVSDKSLAVVLAFRLSKFEEQLP
jgi:hypothetical protein